MCTVWVPGGGAFVPTARDAVVEDVRWIVDAELPDHSAIDVIVSGLPTRPWLERLPAVRTVIVPYAGVPARTTALLQAFPTVALHNLHHNAQPTAEMAMALYLAVAKRVVPIDQQLRRGDWRVRYIPPVSQSVAGKTAVIWGWGAIGRRIARACTGLGMSVIGIRRSQPEQREQGAEGDGVRIVSSAQASAVLPVANALFVAVPSTAETKGLIDTHVLTQLPRGAIVINVARGSVVDEQALYDGLISGALGGAGLDVWWRYPRTPQDRAAMAPSYLPFHQLPHVVFSPHRGGMTQATESLRGHALAQLINQAASKQPVSNRVDLTLGY